ncbi:hypothetical protein AB6A40_001969 [Gnathostoma spinigerum]|uniref:Uncharacterized protein n=1 Tax=Gnathostoma spinigerum TaxID=75299 RepID=A0ABD6E5F7_9BILA
MNNKAKRPVKSFRNFRKKSFIWSGWVLYGHLGHFGAVQLPHALASSFLEISHFCWSLIIRFFIIFCSTT